MNGKKTALVMMSLGLVLGACEEQSKNKVVIGRKSNPECDLSTDNLVGTQWVLLKFNPDKSETPDPKTRIKIYEEAGAIKAKYTVSSFSDVYTYNCTRVKDELVCKEEPKVKDWCQALVTGGVECTPESLRAIDSSLTDAQIKEGIEAATKVIDKYRGTPNWDRFVFNNNNLGNKLQGVFYLRVEKRNCRMLITDHYVTIYNGKKVEDSNPVGTNPIVRSDKELLWEHCTDSTDLVAMKTPEFPKNEKELLAGICVPNQQCSFSTGEDVYYQYIGQDARVPENDCKYSFDLWSNWEPLKKGLVAQEVDVGRGKKELRWQYTHQYDTRGTPVLEMVRYKTCNGKKEKVETSCNLILVQ